MKTSAILALLFIGAVIYYVSGGGALFGLTTPQKSPESVVAPNATFLGKEKLNPYAE